MDSRCFTSENLTKIDQFVHFPKSDYRPTQAVIFCAILNNRKCWMMPPGCLSYSVCRQFLLPELAMTWFMCIFIKSVSRLPEHFALFM